jgi:hypothetical protein
MKRVVFLLGVGVGFVLGSKMGSEPYDELQRRARSVMSRPEVRETIDKAKGAVTGQVNETVHDVKDRLPLSVMS